MAFCRAVPLPLGSWQGILITLGLLAYDALMIWWLRRLIIKCRPWWTFGVALVLVSPVPVAAIAWVVEHRPPWQLLDLNRQSWALMFGDLALAALLGVCAYGWFALPYDKQLKYRRPSWLVISLLFGLALAALFRWNESGVYDLFRYTSYTKLFHDLVSYVVLATMVIFAAWPVLRHRPRETVRRRRIPVRTLVVLLVVVWIGGGVHDAMHGLNPAFLHPRRPSAEQFDPRPTDVLARNACQAQARG